MSFSKGKRQNVGENNRKKKLSTGILSSIFGIVIGEVKKLAELKWLKKE